MKTLLIILFGWIVIIPVTVVGVALFVAIKRRNAENAIIRRLVARDKNFVLPDYWEYANEEWRRMCLDTLRGFK